MNQLVVKKKRLSVIFLIKRMSKLFYFLVLLFCFFSVRIEVKPIKIHLTSNDFFQSKDTIEKVYRVVETKAQMPDGWQQSFV